VRDDSDKRKNREDLLDMRAARESGSLRLIELSQQDEFTHNEW
jgi:hypothetical protein